MDTRSIVRTAAVATVAMLLLTLVFAVTTAFAEEAKAPATTAAAEAKGGEAAAGEAKAGEKKEIAHTVGNLTPAQKQDLRRAWDGVAGFDLLAVSVIGLGAAAGIIGFGAFKQMKL